MQQLCNSYGSYANFIHKMKLFGWFIHSAHFRLVYTSAGLFTSIISVRLFQHFVTCSELVKTSSGNVRMLFLASNIPISFSLCLILSRMCSSTSSSVFACTSMNTSPSCKRTYISIEE